MKSLVKTVVVVAFLVAIALVALVTFADRLVKRGVEEGGTYALGVETTLTGVGLDLRQGQVDLSGLRVANPEGYPDPHLLTVQSMRLVVPPRNLLAEIVEVELLSLDDATITLDRREGRTNFEQILENLERFEGDAPPAEAPEDPKRFRIRKLRLEGLRAHIDLGLSGAVQQAGEIDVALAPIEIDNLGTESDGLSVPELARTIITVLLQSSIEAGGANIPAEIRARLEGALGDAEQRLETSIGELEQKVGDVERQVGDAVEGAKGEIDGALRGAKDLERNLGERFKKPDAKDDDGSRR